jgi:hypothetical protein
MAYLVPLRRWIVGVPQTGREIHVEPGKTSLWVLAFSSSQILAEVSRRTTYKHLAEAVVARLTTQQAIKAISDLKLVSALGNKLDWKECIEVPDFPPNVYIKVAKCQIFYTEDHRQKTKPVNRILNADILLTLISA